MFHCENDGVDDRLKSLWIQLDHTLSAIQNDVVDKLEEAFSEFRVWNEIIADHVKCRLAETEENLIQESWEHVALFLHHSGEEH